MAGSFVEAHLLREPHEFGEGFLSVLAVGAPALRYSAECVLAYSGDESATALFSAIPDAEVCGDVGAVVTQRVVRSCVFAPTGRGEADADTACCVRRVVVAVGAHHRFACVLVATAMPKTTPARKQKVRDLTRLELIDNGVS